MLTLPPLSLYIHLPWCVRKCPYCDFNSHAAADWPEQAYATALLQDLEADLHYVQGRPLQSIFFGGGTPSLFSPDTIARLLEGIRQHIPFAPDIEVTLEANPGTAEAGRFRGYAEAGVNRLSIGVQSFQPRHLAALGRIHDPGQARAAVGMAQAAGFRRINVDLMHGLPGQTPAEAEADLEEALGLGVDHLSWYQLTIEPNTAFHRSPPPLPPDPVLEVIQEAGAARLAAAGFRHYEVSAFCRDKTAACRHNINYWEFGDYLGIGAGAHGKLTKPGTGQILRTRKTRLPRHYLERAGGWTAETLAIPPAERPGECLLNALRLADGIPANLFPARTGLPLSALEPMRKQLVERGLLVADPARLATTPLGFRFLNDVLMPFI